MRKKKKRTARKPMIGPPPEVMDIKTLAQYLGMGRSKIYNLIRQKKIPASRIGRQYRFAKGLIDQWLEEQLIIRPDESQIPLFKGK
ncbi:helix-turn-helix domain-containing protein [Elusimicrobiota bacterium]